MHKSLNYLFRRGKAWLKRRLRFHTAPKALPDAWPYQKWLKQRIADRKSDYAPVAEKNLFSILTPVFDPPAGFLRVLGKSIFAQDHQDWQWVLVDNGCRQPDVLYLLEKFSRDGRVKLVRAPNALGIIGGMRLALEQAAGRYVCPIDHDDRIYPDALRVVAAYLQTLDWPKIAYSDEDKLLPDGSSAYPFLKPDWDPLLFLNCCYVAHLGIMERKTALELGVYSDPASEGTPDGDAFCRFLSSGHEPVHVAEVLYSWRMHPQSTALLGVAAKPYVIDSQRHAYGRYLSQRNLADCITLTTNSLVGTIGTWRVAAKQGHKSEIQSSKSEGVSSLGFRVSGFPLLLGPGAPDHIRQITLDRLALASNIGPIIHVGYRPESLLEALLQFPDEDWVCLLNPHYLPVTTDFTLEADCIRRAVPDSVAIGGIILDDQQRIETAGLVWGLDGILGSPLRGRAPDQVSLGAGALAFQRAVTAISHRFFFAKVGFLRCVTYQHELDFDNPLLPAWLAAYAQIQGKRILFSPYIRCQPLADVVPRQNNYLEEANFLAKFGALLRQDRYYSPFFGLTNEHGYSLVYPHARANELNKYLTIWAGDSTDRASGSDIIEFSVSKDRFTSPLAIKIEELRESSQLLRSVSSFHQVPMTWSRQTPPGPGNPGHRGNSITKSQR
jgi:hypothetical protein